MSDLLPEEIDRIRQIVGDDAFNKTLDRLEKRHVDAWARSGPTDTEAREAAYWRLTALRDIRQTLQSVLDDEKFAAKRART